METERRFVSASMASITNRHEPAATPMNTVTKNAKTFFIARGLWGESVHYSRHAPAVAVLKITLAFQGAGVGVRVHA